MQAIKPQTLQTVQTVRLASEAMADAAHIVLGTSATLARNELSAMRGHRADLAERLGVARTAHDVFELIDNQLDLLHETRRRLADDQQRRRDTLLRLRDNLAYVGQRLHRKPL